MKRLSDLIETTIGEKEDSFTLVCYLIETVVVQSFLERFFSGWQTTIK